METIYILYVCCVNVQVQTTLKFQLLKSRVLNERYLILIMWYENWWFTWNVFSNFKYGEADWKHKMKTRKIYKRKIFFEYFATVKNTEFLITAAKKSYLCQSRKHSKYCTFDKKCLLSFLDERKGMNFRFYFR